MSKWKISRANIEQDSISNKHFGYITFPSKIFRFGERDTNLYLSATWREVNLYEKYDGEGLCS